LSLPFFATKHPISFSLHYSAVCYSTGLTVSSAERTNSDDIPNTVAGVIPSAASSVSQTSEACFFSPHIEAGHPKRKLPPTINSFPILCLNCYENSDEYMKADFETKTGICKKCNHVATAEEYDTAGFTNACLFDKKESSRSGFKKHTEMAYLSCLADVKRAENERSMISMRQKAMELKVLELERVARLDDKCQSQQDQLLKFQADANAAMQR
jgi:hypothetical protein